MYIGHLYRSRLLDGTKLLEIRKNTTSRYYGKNIKILKTRTDIFVNRSFISRSRLQQGHLLVIYVGHVGQGYKEYQE